MRAAQKEGHSPCGGYYGKSDALDEVIGKFAMSYAKQTGQDREAFAKAKRAGQIKVATEASH